MKLKKVHWIGMLFAILLLLADLAIFLLNRQDKNLFVFILGIALAIVVLPFIIGVAAESRKEQEINSMFLEFSRNLVESVKTGTPISKSIVNMRNKNYGALTPAVQKLANQIELGIPLHQAFEVFAKETKSSVIARAVALIREAERAGGEIDYILDSVAKSIAETEKLKKERKATIYNLVVQGYIIFFIFVGIMLVMEFKILPLTAGIGGVNVFGGLSSGFEATQSASSLSPESLATPFLYLLLVQGFFAGLIIGKLAEGKIKSGIKHSFILVVLAFLISTGARLFLG